MLCKVPSRVTAYRDTHATFQFSDSLSLHVPLSRVQLFTRDVLVLDLVLDLVNSLISSR